MRYPMIALVLLLLLSAVTACNAVQYRVRDLGWLGPDYSEIGAYAISDSGLIIGSGVSQQDNVTYSAVWGRDGHVTPLEVVGIRSEASGINSSGTIVGKAYMSSNDPYAVVWDTTGAVTRTIGPGTALAINDDGQILLYDKSGYLVSNPDGTSYSLHSISEYRYSVASSLSGNSLAAGYAVDSSYRRHAVAWDAQGNGSVLTDVPGSTGLDIYGINNAGRIVGYAKDSVSTSAVVWDASGACPGGSGKLPVTRLYSMPPSQNCQCLL